MSMVSNLRETIARTLGDDTWNRVIQKYGWSKFQRQNKDLSACISSNKRFKDLYSSKRCFVIGNGPSLNSQDLSLLMDEYVFTCNQIMRNPIYPKIKSNFHFFADTSFFQIHRDNSAEMEIVDLMKKINTNENKPLCFFASEGYQFSNEFGLKDILDLHFFEHRLLLTDAFYEEIDFSRFVPNMHTVVHYAIAMAIYMGFSEIYLLGCDCTNVVTALNMRLKNGEGAEYAYAITENEKRRMQERNSRIGLEDELYSFSEVFRCYRVLYEYSKRRGIKLVNCSKGGLLDSLPRCLYEEIVALNGKV